MSNKEVKLDKTLIESDLENIQEKYLQKFYSKNIDNIVKSALENSGLTYNFNDRTHNFEVNITSVFSIKAVWCGSECTYSIDLRGEYNGSKGQYGYDITVSPEAISTLLNVFKSEISKFKALEEKYRKITNIESDAKMLEHQVCDLLQNNKGIEVIPRDKSSFKFKIVKYIVKGLRVCINTTADSYIKDCNTFKQVIDNIPSFFNNKLWKEAYAESTYGWMANDDNEFPSLIWNPENPKMIYKSLPQLHPKLFQAGMGKDEVLIESALDNMGFVYHYEDNVLHVAVNQEIELCRDHKTTFFMKPEGKKQRI